MGKNMEKKKKHKHVFNCFHSYFAFKYRMFDRSTYRVCEIEIEVLHTKVEELLLLQRSTYISDNFLRDKDTQT